jgi:hypothetical protein
MSALPAFLDPPARSIADLEATFTHIDARRFEWLAAQLRDADRPHAAELADNWARELFAIARLARLESAAK